MIQFLITSNYWMRLSRIWRILQIGEGVIHRRLRPRWITFSEICRIFHILRKSNSIVALLFIQNIFKLLKEKRSFTFNNFVPIHPFFSPRRKTASKSTAFVGFLFFSPRWDSKIKRSCFVNFLVFSLSLSFGNWAIFSSLKLLNLLAPIFLLNKNNAISSPAFFGQRFNNLQRAALLTSIIQYHEVSFQTWWAAAGYGKLCVSETGKYFEWIIMSVIQGYNMFFFFLLPSIFLLCKGKCYDVIAQFLTPVAFPVTLKVDVLKHEQLNCVQLQFHVSFVLFRNNHCNWALVIQRWNNERKTNKGRGSNCYCILK